VNSSYLRRPTPATLLREHQSVIGAPLDRVFAALAAAVDPGPESHFAVDPAAGMIVVQGGWWYRAEYLVTADSAGTRIQFTLLNVASPAHWAGPITGRAAIRSSAHDFGDVIEKVRLSSSASPSAG